MKLSREVSVRPNELASRKAFEMKFDELKNICWQMTTLLSSVHCHTFADSYHCARSNHGAYGAVWLRSIVCLYFVM